MEMRFEFKFVTLALTIASMTLFAAVSVRAQEDEITSIDDFLEETDGNAGTDFASGESSKSDESNKNGENPNSAPSSNVTQLDELSVETDAEAEQVKQAKKVEAVSTIDAAELQNTSKSVSKAVNSSSGVKVRKSGGMGGEGKINIRGMEGKNIKVLVKPRATSASTIFPLIRLPISKCTKATFRRVLQQTAQVVPSTL